MSVLKHVNNVRAKAEAIRVAESISTLEKKGLNVEVMSNPYTKAFFRITWE